MAPLLTRICFLFLVMETLIGMVANGSIVFINFIDWMRSRKLSPMDLILICLGLSRLWLQAVVILDVTLFILISNTHRNVTLMLTAIWIYTNNVNLWLAACLSVFYLAKIAIFSHPVFLHLKRQFSGLLPWLLLGSVVYSAVVTIIAMTSWYYGCVMYNSQKSLLSNRSNTEKNLPHTCRHVGVLISVSDIIPFIVFLSSSILLISSLWKHMRRVQGNGTGTRDLNTQAHLSAIKALASFAVLYLISFAAATSQSVLAWSNQPILTIILFNVSAVYPSGHAIILILINPKLKQAWVRMVHCLKCNLSKEPS